MSINPISLQNLKPGIHFKGGKQPIRLSLLPDTIAWLKRGGNASQRVEDLVEAALSKQLKPDNSNDSHKQITELKAQIETLTQELEECKSNHSHKQNLDEQVDREIVKVFKVGRQSPTYKKVRQVVQAVLSD